MHLLYFKIKEVYYLINWEICLYEEKGQVI